MNAAVLERPRRFTPVTSTSPTMRPAQRTFISHPVDGEDSARPTEIGESVDFLSFDFHNTMTASTVDTQSEHIGIMHRLRLYTGTALLGAVVSGLALGWLGHRELIQCAGAAAAIVIYAVISNWRRDNRVG
jgi:hypothetical protein